MGNKQTYSLTRKAIRLAELIAQAKPARLCFKSEQQFLEMLGLQPTAVPVRVERYIDVRAEKGRR